MDNFGASFENINIMEWIAKSTLYLISQSLSSCVHSVRSVCVDMYLCIWYTFVNKKLSKRIPNVARIKRKRKWNIVLKSNVTSRFFIVVNTIWKMHSWENCAECFYITIFYYTAFIEFRNDEKRIVNQLSESGK